LEEQRTDGRTSGMNNRCELALFMRIHSWLPRDLSHLNGGPTWAPNRVLLSHFWVRCLPQSGATPIYHLAPEGANRKSIFFGRGFSTGLSGPLRRCSSMCTSKSKGYVVFGRLLWKICKLEIYVYLGKASLLVLTFKLFLFLMIRSYLKVHRYLSKMSIF